METFKEKSEWNVLEIQKDIDQKASALKALSGSLAEHYKMLSSYVAKLKKVYKHRLFSTMVERHNRFKRMFVGFDALKEGILGGCRLVIPLDGCFLKIEVGGQLLSAVSRDDNNKMFPVCWAVVEEHRNCARHLYANGKKKHDGYTLKNLFWKVAKSTTEANFNEKMYQMKINFENQGVQINFENQGVQSQGSLQPLAKRSKMAVIKRPDCYESLVHNERTHVAKG
ncbi:hypothetical protein Cni_G13490 [Canna indica]|uniref:Uncharacterized protein n=1 Tax=Canna indica TaxID=4628 RepID=A0AAQ3QD48_9LILI|nr:hypothetical protein Cni_G13490 [Canna indica]